MKPQTKSRVTWLLIIIVTLAVISYVVLTVFTTQPNFKCTTTDNQTGAITTEEVFLDVQDGFDGSMGVVNGNKVICERIT